MKHSPYVSTSDTVKKTRKKRKFTSRAESLPGWGLVLSLLNNPDSARVTSWHVRKDHAAAVKIKGNRTIPAFIKKQVANLPFYFKITVDPGDASSPETIYQIERVRAAKKLA